MSSAEFFTHLPTCKVLKIAQHVMIEPPHDETNKLTCASSEDSDQPGYPPSLISLPCALNGQLRAQAFFMRTLISLGGCTGSSLGARAILTVLIIVCVNNGAKLDCNPGRTKRQITPFRYLPFLSETKHRADHLHIQMTVAKHNLRPTQVGRIYRHEAMYLPDENHEHCCNLLLHHWPGPIFHSDTLQMV